MIKRTDADRIKILGMITAYLRWYNDGEPLKQPLSPEALIYKMHEHNTNAISEVTAATLFDEHPEHSGLVRMTNHYHYKYHYLFRPNADRPNDELTIEEMEKQLETNYPKAYTEYQERLRNPSKYREYVEATTPKNAPRDIPKYLKEQATANQLIIIRAVVAILRHYEPPFVNRRGEWKVRKHPLDFRTLAYTLENSFNSRKHTRALNLIPFISNSASDITINHTFGNLVKGRTESSIWPKDIAIYTQDDSDAGSAAVLDALKRNYPLAYNDFLVMQEKPEQYQTYVDSAPKPVIAPPPPDPLMKEQTLVLSNSDLRTILGQVLGNGSRAYEVLRRLHECNQKGAVR